MPKCIVIGSGISGIATSIRLSRQGFDVTVFEANSYVGGKLSEFENNGYRFDAGPSLFTMPEYVEDLFKLCGEDPKQHFEYIKLDKSCHYFFEDGQRFECPSNRMEMAEKMKLVFGEDKNKILKFLNKSSKMYSITKPVFLENSLHQLSTYCSYSGLKGILNLWRLNMFQTMNKANMKWFKNTKTVQFFNRFATYNGSNPYKAPATLNIIPHLEFGIGSFFPKKGMIDISHSLHQLAERQGVQFKFNHKVKEIIYENQKVKGVMVNDVFYEADVVVSNMDISPTYKYLLPNLPTPKHVLKSQASSSALIFYWGINKQFPELDLHNIFFSNDYQKEFEQIFIDNTVGDDPTVYVHISSKYKINDAPSNAENWFVMVNAPANNGQNWDQMIEKTRQNIISKINKSLGVNLKDIICNESILDPRTIELKTSSNKGALYGSSSNHRMSAFFRHPNFKNKIKNLYFCGGSVHPGGGIPLCLLSAKIVSDLVRRDQRHKKFI